MGRFRLAGGVGSCGVERAGRGVASLKQKAAGGEALDLGDGKFGETRGDVDVFEVRASEGAGNHE